MIPKIEEFDLNKMPKESEPQNFRANASYAWETLAQMAVDYNSSITAINSLVDTANSIKTDITNLNVEITNSKNKIYAYKQEAVNAMQTIKSVVIPTTATYSKEAVDSMLNSVLTEQVRQNLQIQILK